MTIITLIIFLLASVSLTNIVVREYIFSFIREYLIKKSPNFFGKLISCPTCFGFWSGILISLFFPINFFIGGLISSIVCYIFFKYLSQSF